MCAAVQISFPQRKHDASNAYWYIGTAADYAANNYSNTTTTISTSDGPDRKVKKRLILNVLNFVIPR